MAIRTKPALNAAQSEMAYTKTPEAEPHRVASPATDSTTDNNNNNNNKASTPDSDSTLEDIATTPASESTAASQAEGPAPLSESDRQALLQELAEDEAEIEYNLRIEELSRLQLERIEATIKALEQKIDNRNAAKPKRQSKRMMTAMGRIQSTPGTVTERRFTYL